MKLLKKRIISQILVLGVILSSSTSAQTTSGKLVNGVIPDNMPPGTIIKFDDTNQPVIIGRENIGYVRGRAGINEDTSGREEEDAFFEKIAKEALRLPRYELEPYAPNPGTIVTYGTQGTPIDIQNNNAAVSARLLSMGTRKPAGQYIFGPASMRQTITITSNAVTGEGTFTVFEDVSGDHDDPSTGKPYKLKTGDVATNGNYDNPMYGTKIEARALETDVKKTMTKNDYGNLPAAVLDIWKWNGTLFGYEYTDKLSFDGRYYYTF